MSRGAHVHLDSRHPNSSFHPTRTVSVIFLPCNIGGRKRRVGAVGRLGLGNTALKFIFLN
jgi:hypothetical protein